MRALGVDERVVVEALLCTALYLYHIKMEGGRGMGRRRRRTRQIN
jgi:hypothetical protein